MNVAGAEAEDEIARCQHIADVAMHAHKTRLVSHTAMTVRRYRIGDGLAADSRNGRLARRINIGDHHTVGIVEGAPKFAAQRFCARVAMGLEHRQDALPAGRARGGEGR